MATPYTPGYSEFQEAAAYRQQAEEHAMRQSMGGLKLRGILSEIQAQNDKKRSLEEFASTLPPAEQLKFRVDPAGYLKSIRPDPQRDAATALAGLLSTGGYQAPAGTPQTDGAAGPADAVAMSDQEALLKLGAKMNPDGTITMVGQAPPMSVNVPSQANVRALSVIAEPEKAIPEILRQQRPPAAQRPQQDYMPVSGGYLERQPDGTAKFVRTAPEAAPRVDPLVPVKGADGKPILLPRSEAAGMTPASLSGREDDHMLRRVMEFGKTIEKAGFAESYAVLDEAARLVTPDTVKYLAGPAAYVPDAALDKPVKNARQALSRLFNITLKDRSGAAVTIPEFERLKKEFGTGLWNTPDQVTEGLRQAREVLDKHYASVSAGFPEDVRSKYFEQMKSAVPFGGTGGSPTLPAAPAQKKVIRTGTFNGRKVRQYEDGTTEYIQ